MGILDEAIKEHLELKRQQGAAEGELQQLEDEAFGAAERPGAEQSVPDSAAEAPTEFMEQPDLGEAEADVPEVLDEGAGRPRPRAEIADLQEPPEAPAAEPQPVAPDEPESSAEPEPEEPAEEEAPAMEHEAISDPEPPPGPSTEERHAIAEQPTEMFDVEAELADVEAEAPAAEIQAPSREAPAEEADEDDDFWDEKRLSDELDQALEAPLDAEEEDEAENAIEVERNDPERAADEDVLEETPDFLEEAPEDDQLWFEQKPPKDFDFDD